MVIASMLTTADVTYDEYKATPADLLQLSTKPSSDGGAMGGKDSRGWLLPAHYRLGSLGCLIKIGCFLGGSRSPESKQNCSNGWSLVKDTIAYSSESTYAANLEMATNEYKPSNRVAWKKIETRRNAG